jgi:hypothetical protein
VLEALHETKTVAQIASEHQLRSDPANQIIVDIARIPASPLVTMDTKIRVSPHARVAYQPPHPLTKKRPQRQLPNELFHPRMASQ